MSKALISIMNKHINALDELLKQIQGPKNGLAIEDRKYHLKIYPQTFIGRELVDWFITNKIFSSREDAVAFGKVLLERGVIRHCTQAHDFKDEYLFYVILPAFQLVTLLQKDTEKLLSERRISRYDGNNVQIGSKKNEAHKVRCYKIQEIIDTEKSYLRSLDVAIRYYKVVLVSRQDLIPEAKIKQIFGNIEEIIMTSHAFLRALYKNIPDDFSESICIGQIFQEFAPHWNAYATYAHRHQDAIALMIDLEHKKDPVVDFIQNIRDENNLSDLMSLLIQPVQRIPRYKLLLEDIQKKTPSAHPDKEPLNQAIARVEEIASLVNESIREYEAMKDVDRALKQFGYPKELDDVSLEGSSVLAEGWLAKVTRRGPAVRRFVVLQIPKAPNGGAIYYARAALSAVPSRLSVSFNLTGVQRLATGAYFAQDMPADSRVQFAFKLLGKGKSFVCIATSEEEKKMWIAAFNKLAGPDAQNNFAPLWVGDDHSNSCLRCNRVFNAICRRHHCRNCGILVCHKCSANKALVKVVHPTNPTRVCDTCFEMIEGVRSTDNSAMLFDDDNDDESEFEKLKWSAEDIQRSFMQTAAVMVQRLALTMSQHNVSSIVQTGTGDSSNNSTPRTSVNDDDKKVVIGRKSTNDSSSYDDASSGRNGASDTDSNTSSTSNRNSGDFAPTRTRSSHILAPTGANFARFALMTPVSESESPIGSPKPRSWVSGGSDSVDGSERKVQTGFLSTRGRSSGEGSRDSNSSQ